MKNLKVESGKLKIEISSRFARAMASAWSTSAGISRMKQTRQKREKEDLQDFQDCAQREKVKIKN